MSEVHAGRLQHREIGRLAARIGGEILIGSELLRIDEDRRDDAAAIGSGSLHERQVPLVQRAHRRHQADPIVTLAPKREPPSQIGNGSRHFHSSLLNLLPNPR